MPSAVRGRAEVSRYLRQLPEHITKVLHGSGRAGGKVVAEDAKRRCRSDAVGEAVVEKTEVDGLQVRVRITVKPGWARSVAIWLEYGTSSHFITVDDDQRQGMTARRINSTGKARSLLINGKPVGTSVFHPGAQPHPFLRPALDASRAEAIAAAQAYVTARIGHNGGPALDDEDDDA
jgi:hypothetical protein